MNKVILIIGFVVVSITIILWMYISRDIGKKWGDNFQSSPYELMGCIDERMMKIICYTNKAKYGENWTITCPKCSVYYESSYEWLNGISDCDLHAFCAFNKDKSGTICFFAFDATREPTRIYCNQCGYPLGTDWKVYNR